MADIGHNSEVNSGQLRALVERIETIERDIKDRQEDRKEIFIEAKSHGFDVRILRKVIAHRKMDRQKRIEEEEILSLYLGALGELADTPLGQADVARAFG